MSDSINNFQQFFRDVEAEIAALKIAIRAKHEAARPVPTESYASTIGETPVMHFAGPVEPFTLTMRQLEVVRACWDDVQGFLWVNSVTEKRNLVNSSHSMKSSMADGGKGWAAERTAELGLPPSARSRPLSGAREVKAETTIQGHVKSTGGELPIRERPNYGISRIDQPEKATQGWYVRITKNGSTEQKFFADKSYGGRDAAWEQAREHRDLLKEQILGIPRSTPPVTSQEASSSPSP